VDRTRLAVLIPAAAQVATAGKFAFLSKFFPQPLWLPDRAEAAFFC
jgi:hypothetical protein